MAGIIYNDDVNMYDSSYYNGSNTNTDISDSSTPGTHPSVNPIPVIDNTSRPTDGWLINNDPNGGSAGETYNDTPPIEQDPLEYSTEIIKQKRRIIIRDYSAEYLRELYSQGYKFYVIYKDGTEDEIEYTEVHDPNPVVVHVYNSEAYDIANAINQHFWEDTNGAHITDNTKDEWELAIADGFSDLSTDKQYHNVLINSLGLLLRSALNNLLAISRSGTTIYDGSGNNITNVLAIFGKDGASFREGGKTRATVTTRGLTIYDDSGSIQNNTETYGTEVAFIGTDSLGKPYAKIGKTTSSYIIIGINESDEAYIDFYSGSTLMAHIGYEDGINSSGGHTIAPTYTFGRRSNYPLSQRLLNETEDVPWWSGSGKSYTKGDVVRYTSNGRTVYAFCLSTHTSSNSEKPSTSSKWAMPVDEKGNYSFATGESSFSYGYSSVAQGHNVSAIGGGAHAEGSQTVAYGVSSHAEGRFTYAFERGSHSEGSFTTSIGLGSHAEGIQTKASGSGAHSEGYHTISSGPYSHAAGYYTVAGYNYQTVCGKYNRNVSNSLFEVGNGNSSVLKNALTVLDTGSVYFNGSSSSNGTVVTSDSRIKKLISELNSEEAITFIKSLIPKHYYKNGLEEYGFYAQDVEKLSNFGSVLVSKDNSGIYDLSDYRLLNYNGFIAPIVAVLKDNLNKIEQLENENKKLKEENKKLEDRINRIEKYLNMN